MAKLSDAHTPILRAYFGMIRRWAALMKPNGKNDAELVLDALDADESDETTQVSCRGRAVFLVHTEVDRYGHPRTQATPQPWQAVTQSTEGPPPPSAG